MSGHLGAIDHLLRVRLAEGRFGLLRADVRTVIEPETLTPVPLAADSLLGLTPYRGRAVPVYSVAALLGMARPARGEPMAVICASKGQICGFAVEAVEEVLVGAERPANLELIDAFSLLSATTTSMVEGDRP